MNVRTSPGRAVAAVAEFRDLGRKLALAAILVAFPLALVLAVRRFLESWQRALSGAELLLLTVVLVGSAWGFHRAFPQRRAGAPAWELFASFLCTLAAGLVAVAVSHTESPLWGIILLWAALTCGETWFWVRVAPGPQGVRTAPLPQAQSDRLRDLASIEPSLQTAEAGDASSDDVGTEEPAEESFPHTHLQQFTRFRDDDGEAIHGLLRAELEAGQRVHHLHVAFCPPLTAAPEVHCEQVDGPEATVSLAQAATYGARIDLRLATTAQAGESVVVELYAKCNT